ncbi:phenolic acid decarboxylase, partial [Escherichia coli]
MLISTKQRRPTMSNFDKHDLSGFVGKHLVY